MVTKTTINSNQGSYDSRYQESWDDYTRRQDDQRSQGSKGKYSEEFQCDRWDDSRMMIGKNSAKLKGIIRMKKGFDIDSEVKKDPDMMKDRIEGHFTPVVEAVE